MATDLEKLVVQLSADIKGYEREMRKASGVTNRQAREIENRFRMMNRNLDGIGRQAARSLIMPFTGIAAALGGRELIRMTGAWTDLTSRVNLAAGSMSAGNDVMLRVSEMARRTYSDLTLTAEGYLAFAGTLTELGVSTQRQLDFVESLNNALVVSGAKGQTSASVMGALSKAMALGSLQGDNLNTVIESGGRVSQALADSMGVTTMELRKLGSEGKIGRRELLGITSQMEKLRNEAAEMPGTIQDGFMLLNNALLEYVGRGDDAVGMSGRIAEALTLIADNFEVVADAGLKVAAVLAAAVLGRSIGGMIANLGTATAALVRFAAAMQAAGTLASVGTSIAGLGAAAGPVGALLAGVVAGGMIIYSDRAREAQQKTDELRAELEELGLYSPQVADDLSSLADAVDGIGTDEQLKRIARLKRGLDAVKGGRGGLVEMIFGDPSEIGRILSEMQGAVQNPLLNGLSNEFSRADAPLLAQARQLGDEYQKGKIGADALLATLSEIARQDLSDKAADLVAQLIDAARASGGAEQALTALGANPELDAAADAVAGLRDQMERIAELEGFLSPIQREIADLIRDFEDGQRSAEDTKAALESVARANPDFGPFIAKVIGAIGVLRDLRIEAIAAREAAASVGGGPGDTGGDGELDRQGEATAAFIAEQERINSLSRERQDIERRTERIMSDAAKAGAALTQEEAERLAIAQAAADARRGEEGRSARSGGSGRSGGARGGRGTKDRTEYSDEVIRAREAIRALEDEATALDAAELSLEGYADVLTYAQKRMELLIAAQKQGLTVTPQLSAEIDNLAQEYVAAGNAADQARERHQKFESALEEFRSAQEDVFKGLISGADSFSSALSKVAAKLADMAASRAFDAIWTGGLGNASGNLITRAFGFSQGGWTGSGGKHDPAGVVHRGEYVMDADTVRRAGGPASFDALRRVLKNGYSGGGYVGPSVPVSARSVAAAQSSAPRIIINNNAPGVDVVQEFVGRDEVRLMITKGIAGVSRARSDQQYLGNL